jgi:hypothetical protein
MKRTETDYTLIAEAGGTLVFKRVKAYPSMYLPGRHDGNVNTNIGA